MTNNKRGGFTLIEMLVVVAIIGLLSSVVVVGVGGARQKARDAKRMTDIRQIQNQLENYYASNNSYPAALTSLVSVPSDPLNGTKGYGYTAAASPAQSYVLGACLEGNRVAGVQSVTDALAITNYGTCNCNESATKLAIYCVKS